jgi:PAS domain S-box-containing protein
MKIDSPAKLRAFINATSDVVFRINADWTEMERLHGREFMADTLEPDRAWMDKYIYPEDQAAVLREVKRALASKSTFELEHRVFRLDGSIGWVHTRAVPILDAKGEIVEWFGAASDISERKHMENALRESQERYRDLFESMDEGYCIIEMIFDPPGSHNAVDYRFIEVNPAFEKQSGMRNVVGRRMREFVPSIEQPWLANYRKVALTGEPMRFANEYKGLNRWFDVYAFRVGRPEQHRVAVLFTDITEKVLAREELKRHRDNLQKLVAERTVQLDETHKRMRISDRMAAVGTLAAGLAHDMSNLLLPLGARLDMLLANKRIDPEFHEELVVISALMGHLRDLSRNLALFSRDPAREGIKGSTNLAKWCAAVHKLLDASVGREIAMSSRHGLVCVAPPHVWRRTHAGRGDSREEAERGRSPGGAQQVADSGHGGTPDLFGACRLPGADRVDPRG